MAESFDEALRRLSELETSHVARKATGPGQVRPQDIIRVPALFAARSTGKAADHGGQQHHAKELERVLSGKLRGEQFFDPITVYEVGGRDHCVDGHHRLAVYLTRGVQEPVPVFRLGGTLRDAIAASVRLNSKTFLPMDRKQREEAAWKLVKISHGSKAEQAAWSGMGTSFIAKLRRLRKTLEEQRHNEDWGSLWEAEKLARGTGGERIEWTEEMEQREIEEYRKRLLKTFGQKLHTRTSSVVAALGELIGGQPLVDAVQQLCLEDVVWAGDEEDPAADF
ncbi:MAG: hypothetical protein MEQ84_03450 [Mesorhizobium sp.]|nr:hypothetical protein [Mesorhizobium sp.]